MGVLRRRPEARESRLFAADDGKEDAWSYCDADGRIATHRDLDAPRRQGRPHRALRQRRVTRAEEDTDGDGKIDKWETYDGERLASVAFDTTHRGTPDRRLVYGADGTRAIEVDPKGDGTFVPVNTGSK